jgi:hypothetical protein
VAGTRQVWLVCHDNVGLWEVRRWFSQHSYHLQLRRSYQGWTDIELWVS